ncbi:DEAD-domain-containing protein [Moesziomyces antarcticus]|uniref:DEAD-domain-containing protein n=2 Tax=Pseudozyma antarctica TaxID=84753 RepID=A0A081CB84_PSEA2|nr:DEAD-domain-containing protein [Moesziomyces antarcticus]GAK63930.1 DEAD-domain-containing protein [Moesziomyces antarcticus]SPO44859.1 probable DEAD box protein (putative RNA helicase) [Moesziomyces antarcticus]
MPKASASPAKRVASASASTSTPSPASSAKSNKAKPAPRPPSPSDEDEEEEEEEDSEAEAATASASDHESEDESQGGASGSGSDSDHDEDATAAAPDEAEQDEKKVATLAEDGKKVTFADLGVIPQIVEACTNMGFQHPTPIQVKAIPEALQARDVIGLAQTGSGKTAAFTIPILQALWDNPKPFFACVLAPTRELAYQISQQVEALGSTIGVRSATIVGGMDMMSQSIALSKRPHVIVATPGRLQDHLENTKGFSLRGLQYLVMDEADRLLDMDFGPIIDKLLQSIPRERRTMLFSATMTTKVAKLQRASLKNPVRVEVDTKYTTVSTLKQHYLFMPFAHKDTYLVHLANEQAGHSIIVFTRTVHDSQRLSILLRLLGFPAIPLHGQLSQQARLGALNKFKTGGRSILVATDVASRGLDIPAVDLVVNYDIPTNSKDYIHRVGRTARAGRSGRSVTLVTQYDVELLQRIEAVIALKMTEFPGGNDKEAVMLLSERVAEAHRAAVRELKDKGVGSAGGSGKRKRKMDGRHADDMDRDDDHVQAGMPVSGNGRHQNLNRKKGRR